MVLSMETLPAELRLFSSTYASLGLAMLVSAAIYGLYYVIYQVFFHPIKHIPGPLFAKVSGIPYARSLRNGSMLHWMKQQHDKYGDAVRISPNDVSFISGDTAWPDIYGFRTGKYKGTGEFMKDRNWFPLPNNGTWSIIAADEATHSRMRRGLSHAFSDKALREQEPLLQSYVDLLLNRMSEHAAQGKHVNIVRWYNYITFDIISDLAFGEPLYCLRDSVHHSWITTVIAFVKAFGFAATSNKYPLFAFVDKLRSHLTRDKSAIATRGEFYALAQAKVERRLAKISTGHDEKVTDFWSHIIANQENDGKKLSKVEMVSNAVTLLVAGSETTATTLSGTTYLLLRSPRVYDSLVAEIRSSFSSTKDITIDAVNRLPYLVAVLQEGLRYYPPVPTGFPRVAPPEGGVVSGIYVPVGTGVFVSHYTAYHSPRNFKEPDVFVPERWMGGQEWENDKRDAAQPFSFGPRNCLGKNLALAELRLILAKLLFSFNLELVDKERDWMGEQKCFTLYEKQALMIKLKPVER